MQQGHFPPEVIIQTGDMCHRNLAGGQNGDRTRGIPPTWHQGRLPGGVDMELSPETSTWVVSREAEGLGIEEGKSVWLT